MATLTLRILTNSGDTTKGSTLTNAELDQNLISLNNELKLATADILTKAPISNPTFVNSSADAFTFVAAKPSGIEVGSEYLAFSVNGTTNSSWFGFGIDDVESYVESGKNGTGSYLPINIKVGGTTKVTIATNGNVSFATGAKIQGDFSNATQSSRTAIQSSVTNGVTGVNVIPNGTATDTAIRAWNASDVTNGSYTDIATSAAGSFLRAEKSGTGSYLPLSIFVGGSERARIDTNGVLGVGVTPETSWATTKKIVRIGSGAFLYGDSSVADQFAIGTNSYFDGTNVRYIATSTSCRYFMGSGAHTFGVAVSGTAGDILSYTTPLAINATNSTFGSHAIPASTNTYDLGTTSLRWRNIYTQDLHLSNGIGDYTVIEGVENLYLVNNKTNKSFKFALIEVDPAEVPAKSQVS